MAIRGEAAHRIHPGELGAEGVVSTSVPTLDSFIRGFSPPSLILLDSSDHLVFDLAHMLCVNAVDALHKEVVWVDGGNSIDPYELGRICRRFHLDREEVLDSINVARAFTVYQMVSLIDEMLEKEVERVEAGAVVISCLPDLFNDPDVHWSESFQLMKRCVSKLKTLTEERGLITFVTNYGLGKIMHRRSLKNLLYGSADQILRIENTKQAVKMSMVNEGRSMMYRPVPHNQTTLDEFLGE